MKKVKWKLRDCVIKENELKEKKGKGLGQVLTFGWKRSRCVDFTHLTLKKLNANLFHVKTELKLIDL